jgi:hypothetical protein
MAKQFTQKELDKIRKRAIDTCNSYGYKPMVTSPYGDIVNPVYSTCLGKEYNDAIKAGNEGKLNLWYQKTDSFVKSQGGVGGIFDTLSNLAGQFKDGYDKGVSGQPGVFGMGYDPNVAPQAMQSPEKDKGNIGIWIAVVLILIILIVASIIYFRKK